MLDWLFKDLTPLGQMYTMASILALVFLAALLIHDWIKKHKH